MSKHCASIRLRTNLSVTKGSFYWHFKGRDDLLLAVVEAWRLTHDERDTGADRRYLRHAWERLERLLRIAISRRQDVPGGPFEADDTARLGPPRPDGSPRWSGR